MDDFDAWNARLNARSPLVSRPRLWGERPTHITGSMLSFWRASFRRQRPASSYRPRSAVERTTFDKHAP